jgi:hypothetical protein
MKRISILIVFVLTIAFGGSVGFVIGNHHAALQALNELQMISHSAYGVSENATAKSVFASHYCGVLDRRIATLRNPLKLFHEHRGSYEPESRSRTEIINDLKRERMDWETKKGTPNQQIQPIAGKPGSG